MAWRSVAMWSMARGKSSLRLLQSNYSKGQGFANQMSSTTPNPTARYAALNMVCLQGQTPSAQQLSISDEEQHTAGAMLNRSLKIDVCT
jgi:hypothetical protein